MIIRIHNNDDTDTCDYEGFSIGEIKAKCAERIKLPTWSKGWAEVIEN